MISLSLHKSEAKPRMSVNNKDVIRIYLGYNLFISQKTAPINAVFVKCKQWLATSYLHLSKLLLYN